jgi:hypothetical protein
VIFKSPNTFPNAKLVSEKLGVVVYTRSPSTLERLRQEDCLSPGVYDQPGQHSNTPHHKGKMRLIKEKKKDTNNRVPVAHCNSTYSGGRDQED